MMLFACICLLPTPIDVPIVDHVDLIEVNHFYANDGSLRFDQIIFWDWNGRRSRFEVVDWRMLKRVREEVSDQQIAEWRKAISGTPPPVGRWLGGHAVPVRDHRHGVIRFRLARREAELLSTRDRSTL